MRKIFAAIVIAGMGFAGMPVEALAAAPGAKQNSTATGGLQGIAKNAQQQNLPSVRVQVRTPNGQLVASGTTDQAGAFTFSGLSAGTYTVEIVDVSGQIVGTASVAITAGATATVTLTATAVGTIAAAAGAGGLSLLGLGTIGTVAVIGGAAAATIGAVVATHNNKIVVCHKPAGSAPTTIEIDESAQDMHLGHGDTLGACPASPSK